MERTAMTDAELIREFLKDRSEAAFESLILRHGPLVHRVCRDVLRDPNDVEDAFQATFLVLVRNASSIRDHDGLGRWLYGTALRIAIRAKTQAARRASRQTGDVAMIEARGDADERRRTELRPVVHEELGRLPSGLRDPIILCYFEGLSHDEAARRMGLPIGTFKNRLVRGRDKLRDRLARRGAAVTALLLLLLLGEESDAATMSATLVSSTVQAGVLTHSLRAIPETVPMRVALLAESEIWRPLARYAAIAVITTAVVLSAGLGGGRVPAVWIESPVTLTGPSGTGACH